MCRSQFFFGCSLAYSIDFIIMYQIVVFILNSKISFNKKKIMLLNNHELNLLIICFELWLLLSLFSKTLLQKKIKQCFQSKSSRFIELLWWKWKPLSFSAHNMYDSSILVIFLFLVVYNFIHNHVNRCSRKDNHFLRVKYMELTHIYSDLIYVDCLSVGTSARSHGRAGGFL